MGSCISSSSSTTHEKLESNLKVKMSFQPIETDDNMLSIPSTPIKEKEKEKAMNNINDLPIISVGYNKARVSPLNPLSTYRSFGGSKEETFFDTRAWLESDCEDDFYSVNGDFTPSRGSTPVHNEGTPRHNRTISRQLSRILFEGRPSLRSGSIRSRESTSLHRSISAITPPRAHRSFSEGVVVSNHPETTTTTTTTKRKKLADLFRESIRERNFETPIILEDYETHEANVNLKASPNLPPLPPKPANRAKSMSSNRSRKIPVDDYEKEEPRKSMQRCFPRLISSRTFHEKKKAYIDY